MAAGTSSNVPCPHVIGSTVVELSRTSRTIAPSQLVRISCKNSSNNGLSIRTDADRRPSSKVLLEGPSCIFVGPIESASQETLEALYRQARDAYYSGKPLIVDDMFDKVELKLRWYGSKCVVKYPRCSLRQQSTYADAEVVMVESDRLPVPDSKKTTTTTQLSLNPATRLTESRSDFTITTTKELRSGQEDPSQVFALASVWLLFLGIGSSACLVPVVYTFGQALKDALDSGFSSTSQAPLLQFIAMLNGMLFMMLGSMIGYPVASASVGALQGLWKNDLVAIKGACPNCGEEVFAFVKSSQFNNSPHKAECHVCECLLEFRTKVERSIAMPGKRWVYGRIYLIRRRRMNRGQRWT